MRSQPANSCQPPSRTRRSTSAAACAALTAFLVALAIPAQVEGAEPTPAQKEAELKRVESRIERIRKQVNADVEKRDKLGVQLRDAEQ